MGAPMAMSGVEGDRLLADEGGDKPRIAISTKNATGEGQHPPLLRLQEELGPGERIEEMAENWTEHASTPARPGAVLNNARLVYSEISNEILVRAA